MKLSTKISTFALAIAVTGGVAAAQPTPDVPPTPSTDPAPVDPLTPMTDTTRPAQPTQPPPPTTEPMTEPTSPSKPDSLAFAIGFGYVFPTSLETPNITSVRMRLPSGLTFEPRMVLATSEDKQDDGLGNINSDKTTDLALSLLVRLPVIKHGRVDFEIIGSAGIESVKSDPMGDVNNTTVTTIGLGWGIGLGYWITRHWELSLTASNPLVESKRTSHETSLTAPDTAATTTTFGLVFDPTVAMMLHLYN